MHFVDFIQIPLKERHSHKVMTETISTPEDSKSYAFMHHVESNFDKARNYLAILTDVQICWLVHDLHAVCVQLVSYI